MLGQKNTRKPGAWQLWDLSSLGALVGPVLTLRWFLFGPAVDRGFPGEPLEVSWNGTS